MAGLTLGLNPETAKLSLDEVLYTEFDREIQPGEITALDGLFFNQTTHDNRTVQWAEYENVGLFEEQVDEQERIITSVATGTKTTADIRDWKKTIAIPESYFDDEMHDIVNQSIRQTGTRARTTRDKRAFQFTYGEGFDGTTFTTPDGQALYSNSHTSVSGDTVDNLETGALSPDNLKTLVKSLRLQLAQDGEIGSHHSDGLICPVELFPEATEITKSTLVAQSAENDLNFFSEIYPGLVVGASEFLDSSQNSATNADTSYYLVSRGHRVDRVERRGMKTDLIPPRFDSQDRYMYKASYREISVPKTWEGQAASNGTA
jgi:hypothetical protein